ncbi:MAG: hypothetical protein M0P31_13990 [Solirubrobacteraceae bacterium]|nr:hypothetical protein [Solirubrobacteraceae bacterium]
MTRRDNPVQRRLKRLCEQHGMRCTTQAAPHPALIVHHASRTDHAIVHYLRPRLDWHPPDTTVEDGCRRLHRQMTARPTPAEARALRTVADGRIVHGAPRRWGEWVTRDPLDPHPDQAALNRCRDRAWIAVCIFRCEATITLSRVKMSRTPVS